MPIIGMTDQSESIKEVARIRKGGEKKANAPGSNLDHFRITAKKPWIKMQDDIDVALGTKPKSIRCALAYDTMDLNWWAWYTVYLKGGMLGKADGQYWDYLRDYRTGEVLVSGGQVTKYGQQRDVKLNFDPDEPVYFYTPKSGKNKGKDMPVFAKPEGRLHLVIPEHFGRLNMFTALTHSINDIVNISGQLQDLQLKVNKINEDIDGMGLVLSEVDLIYERRKQEISKPIGDGRGMVDEPLCFVEPTPEWDRVFTFVLKKKARYAVLAPIAASDPGGLPATLLDDAEVSEDYLLGEGGSFSDGVHEGQSASDGLMEGAGDPKAQGSGAQDGGDEGTHGGAGVIDQKVTVDGKESQGYEWPEDLIQELIDAKVGCKDAEKMRGLLERSKIAFPTMGFKYLRMYVSWYTDARKKNEEQTKANEIADGYLADLLSADGES